MSVRTGRPPTSTRCVTYFGCFLLFMGSGFNSQAFGAGYYIGDVGARGAARGGAFVAAPDSTYATHYNPAGLSLLKGLHIDINLALVDFQGNFRRDCPCFNPELRSTPLDFDGGEAALVGQTARTRDVAPIPYIGVAYGFDLPMKPALGLAIYGPMSGRHNFGRVSDGAGNELNAGDDAFANAARDKTTRYLSLTSNNLEINYSLAASFEPIKGLRLGGLLNVYQVEVDQRLHLFVDSQLANGPEDTKYDVPVDISMFSSPELSWGLGLSYDVPFVPGLSIGAAYRAERSLTADGTISVEIPAGLASVASLQGEDVRISLKLPAIFRTGIQYRIPEVFQAEVAFSWEGWSSNRAITLDPQDIQFVIDLGGDTEPVTLDRIEAERGWQDTWSLRVGGELEIFEPWLGIRAGYFHEPTAVPSQRLDASRFDLDKNGYSLGVSTEWHGFTLELTGVYIDMNGINVSDSEVTNIAIELENSIPSLQSLQGNGVYNGSYWIGIVNLGFSLDAFNRAQNSG